MSGKTSTVFAHILRGLSGAKITRAKEEVFRNVAGGGCCVRCSYKADDGFLYPLDKAFFYVHKPPMCINHRSEGCGWGGGGQEGRECSDLSGKEGGVPTP